MAQYLAEDTTSQIGNWVCVEDAVHYEYQYKGLPPVEKRRPMYTKVYEARWTSSAGDVMAPPTGYQLETCTTIREFDSPLSTRTIATFVKKGVWEDAE